MKITTENTGKLLLVLFYFILLSFNGFGQSSKNNQQTRSTINLYFDCNSCSLYKNYHDNATELHRLDSLLSDSIYITSIDTIRICAFSSVEGNKLKNLILANKRANAIRDYIICHHPQYDNNLFVLHTEVGKWENFECIILNHPSVPHKKEMLDIIKSNLSTRAKEYKLRTMYSGKLWNYIKSELLPSQRVGSNMIIYTKKPIYDSSIGNKTNKSNDGKDTIFIMNDSLIKAEDSLFVQDNSDTGDILEPCSVNRKYLFSLKTNLLFDALCIPNVSLEVPLGHHISLSGSWTFPWWVAHNDSWALELLYGEIECRYWFSKRYPYNPFSGFFAGLYAGAGYYDIERNNTGYQGEFFIASGMSFGYSHFVNKKHTLSIEYGLGIGFLKTKYRKYDVHYSCIDENHHLIRRQNGSYTWIGPTKACVSLVWNFGKKGRRNHE